MAEVTDADRERARKKLDEASDAFVEGGQDDRAEEGVIAQLIAEVREETARECDEMSLALEHPRADEWDWNSPGRTRSRFYQNHIVHAWRQAGHEMSKRIRRRFLTPPEAQESDDA